MAVYGTVQLGSSGEDVRRLQESLNANGANLNVDGNFGADTQKAVQNYQQQHGMTANGVVGANTWSLLTGTPKNGNIQVEAPVATDWGGISGVSDQTRQNLTRYENGYTPSANVQSALARLETAQGNRPGPFSSSYQQQLDDLYNQIAGRQPFEYDLNGDMLYQQYRDQYARMGQQAMRDTMGQAAAMTGGYGNSYAQLAGQQAYGSYLQELNDRIPELYDRAYGRYADEGNRLAQQYALASDRYADEYGKYRDQYADWMNEMQLAQNAYDTERNFDYNDYGNMLNYWQAQAQAENADYWKNGLGATGITAGTRNGGGTPVLAGDTSVFSFMGGNGEEQAAATPRRSGGSGGSGNGSQTPPAPTDQDLINSLTNPGGLRIFTGETDKNGNRTSWSWTGASPETRENYLNWMKNTRN